MTGKSSKKAQLCAVIMCGGSGTRFWPASRSETPKQFLRLGGTSSLIQDTVARLKGLIPADRIFLLAAEGHKEHLHRHVPDIPDKNYILEPTARNTGPALALAAKRLESISPDIVMAALPADHAIKDVKGFQANIKRAADYARKKSVVVTIGITPDSPETGYGYIELGEEEEEGIRSVIKFVEKPPLKQALVYLSSGRFVWNGGIFVSRIDTLIEGFRKHEPAIYKPLWEKLPPFGAAGFDSRLHEIYPQLPSVSIDYAVMEKLAAVSCVPAQFDWNDLGSWSALEKYWGKDKAGNASSGRYYSIDSEGNIISSGSLEIALIGVNDMVIVERNDVILICAKERSQDVKQLLDLLKKEDREDLL